MTETRVLIKPLGGIAGDMFAGACAALWPHLVADCLADIRAAGVPDDVSFGFEPVMVNGFAAQSFVVSQGHGRIVPTGDYAAIVARLKDSALAAPVLDTALGILHRLGEAEAAVHGKTLDHVHFHELADWDSIVDVVAAASFIARAGVAHWAVTALPLGGGTADTQHGRITVPAPAVLGLLRGHAFVDDGYPGERITPTGAAILAYLTDPKDGQPGGLLAGDGFGAGTRRYKGLANVVQLLAFEGTDARQTETVTEITFDIDDMTGEEMAVAADRIRDHAGVLDVIQTPQIGKKGRAITLFRVMCRVEASEGVQTLCLSETSTLGLRVASVARRVLERAHASDGIATKTAHRPGGTTAKAESDDLAPIDTLKARRAAAHRAETEALS